MLNYGELVSWKSVGCSLTALRDGLSATGLDENMARELLPRNAFKRAVHKLSEGRIIKQVREDEQKIYFQFTKEANLGDKLEYNYEAIIELEKSSGVCWSNEDLVLAAKAKQLLDEALGVRTTADVSRLIQKIFDSHKGDLMPFRDQGGVYFVPQAHTGLCDTIGELLGRIGGSLRRVQIAVHDEIAGYETRRSLAETMVDHFDGLLSEFKESCESITSDSDDSVIERRQLKLGELKTKLTAYSGILKDQADRIEDSINQAERELLASLVEV